VHGSNAMLEIFPYSYLHLKLEKILCLSYYLLYFLFNKIREEEGGTRSAWKQREEGKVAQTTYTHVNKCKNDKIKKTQKKNILTEGLAYCMRPILMS
jgi:hypothetical protein